MTEDDAPSPDTLLREVVEDLDAALARFDDADSARSHRCTLREALAHLHVLREYRRSPAPGTYFALVDSDPAGRLTEGVVYIRGKLAHNVVAERMGPEYQGAYFSPEVFDMRYFSCGILVWRDDPTVTASPDRESERQRISRERYRDLVAGQPVRETLATARDYLVAVL